MKITEILNSSFIFYDGGMGTLLQKNGLKPGVLPETVNLDNPELLISIHEDYYKSGCNIVNTNTFGANCLKFDNLEDIVVSAVNCVKRARQNTDYLGTKRYISLDIGPTGRMLSPLGDLDFEDAVEVFKKTIKFGADAGADLITIETMNDLYEAKAAVIAAKECCDLPIFLSFVFDTDGKIMTGADIRTVVTTFEAMGVAAIGMNCSLGPRQMRNFVDEFVKYSSIPVIVNPNAGMPTVRNGETVYDITSDQFAECMADIAQLGATVVGGCCGTTPEYISKMITALKNIKPQPITKKNYTAVCSYTHTVEFDRRPIMIGERINPTGKPKFRAALKENNIDYILQEGVSQSENDADILDVNVGLPEIDECAMLKNCVFSLQSVLDLPLQIDTADGVAMESAMRIYNGKPLINSVNGKEESMKTVFPLVKKYGGTVIALTLDENGIPNTARGRADIAKRIVECAEAYGIERKDIIVDPLAMAVSADPKSALVTLEAIKIIKSELSVKTSLGISNISFGLPNREFVTASFLTLAMQTGLDAAIMNVCAAEMKKAYYSYLALCDLDDNFSKYITFAESADTVTTIGEKKNSSKETTDPLKSAIIKGLCEQADKIASELLKTEQPLQIINNEIIPALDIVGKGFENKTVYLPQLLMSAEAAKAAFTQVKNKIGIGSKKSNEKIVLATVKGDIHDIGKNIVKVLCENYGFDVIDLGKDVDPQAVVDAVMESNAKIVGLSALMTTTVPAMQQTVEMIKSTAPWCKTVVGGAVLTQEYADMIGADKYAKDAMETVRYAESVYR
ncbi:MAG: homocysteine S-methyltransferase family protein [Acutalibacteraceae bacterium]|nr:homocysteine S-methyltransferase family protein [Acutalibacteraceae bacterium]